MKIERDRRDDVTRAAPGATPPVRLDDAARSTYAFATALQRHREHASASHSRTPGSDDARSRRTTARPSATTGPRDSRARVQVFDSATASSPTISPTISPTGPQRPPLAPRSRGGIPCDGLAAAAAAWRPLWRRPAGASHLSPCLEIRHAPSGACFVLSRENGVWLLSIRTMDALPRTDRDSLVATLRAHFAARGLGTVELVV
jgi:hypothetical protein